MNVKGRRILDLEKKPFSRVNELSAYERETVILFNEAEPNAVIATASKSMANKLFALSKEFDEFKLVKMDEWGAEFSIPKKRITIRKPVAMTDEQKSAAAQRLEQVRKRIEDNRKKTQESLEMSDEDIGRACHPYHKNKCENADESQGIRGKKRGS